VPVEIEDTARDIWPLLDKLFQDARNKVQIRMALLPVGTVYARYSNANILLFECLFKVVYDDRSERNPKSASHRSDDLSGKELVRENGFTSTG